MKSIQNLTTSWPLPLLLFKFKPPSSPTCVYSLALCLMSIFSVFAQLSYVLITGSPFHISHTAFLTVSWTYQHTPMLEILRTFAVSVRCWIPLSPSPDIYINTSLIFFRSLKSNLSIGAFSGNLNTFSTLYT